MKAFVRLFIAVTAVLAFLWVGANIFLSISDKGDEGRPYRVEAQRIAHKIEKGEDYSLADYNYITDVTIVNEIFSEGESDYLIKKIGGKYYRFDYSIPSDLHNTVLVFNTFFLIISVIVLGTLLYVYFMIIRQFEKLSDYPTELSKGILTKPLKENKRGYLGRFVWGLDLLREKLEKQRVEELELKKQNNTMLLSLSHDIKTPLSIIELYAKALEKGLYNDESKKISIAMSIHDKCEDIRKYVDDITKSAGNDFFDVEVNVSEFYLSDLINNIRLFYSDKLTLLKTDLVINSYSDCLICGDIERSVEVFQNIMENAIKYGDGKTIKLLFSREEDCQLIHILNTGCILSDTELPHIFDSFWRGSNVSSQSGSGLGLYICRRLMEKMDGNIYAEIKDGEMGVTVVFRMK